MGGLLDLEGTEHPDFDDVTDFAISSSVAIHEKGHGLASVSGYSFMDGMASMGMATADAPVVTSTWVYVTH